MPKAIIDLFSKEDLQKIVNESNCFRELAEKLGYHSSGGAKNNTIRDRLEKYNISINHFNDGIKRRKLTKEVVFCCPSSVTQKVLRHWYFVGEYSEYSCSICKLPPMWEGQELVLTLDHINGNCKDNHLENLRWVCPNCDRQLPTFGRKNV